MADQSATWLQAPCRQSVPVKHLMPPGEALLARPGNAVYVGVEAIVAVRDDGDVLIVRLGIGNPARAGATLEGHVVFVNPGVASLYLAPLSVVRPWSISMIPQPPGLTVSVLPYTPTSCDAEMRISAPQNQLPPTPFCREHCCEWRR